MISVDNLSKAIDLSQLTREFDGTLEYEHEQWIQLRLVNIYHISSVIRQSFFLPKQSPELDSSYKMDLDLRECLGKVKFIS